MVIGAGYIGLEMAENPRRGGCGPWCAQLPLAAVPGPAFAAAIVLRLQTVVSREVDPGEPAVLTVASIHADTKANIIAEQAELQINIRSYSEPVRAALLAAIRRIVTAECAASNCPREPDFEMFDQAPLTDNDPEVTARVTEAFTAALGDEVMIAPPRVLGSEDFSDIANGVHAPDSYRLFGGTDPETYLRAAAEDMLASDISVNHSPRFAPVIQPTLDTGTTALVAAALAWLAG